MVDVLGVTDLTTCLYAIVNPSTGTLRWASAGHLNPLVVESSGARLLRGDPGPPLGASAAATYVDRAAEIPREASVLLYTDGLVERRTSSISEGLARLESMRAPFTDPVRLCDHVLHTQLRIGPASDDVTVLAVQPQPEPQLAHPSGLPAVQVGTLSEQA
jgi:serine phosphatase RsbU (regulator of sigma subunit)